MIEVVCGVIRDDAGRVLACQRPADKHLGGLWEFPGGKVEAGESPEAALMRELREELGIEVILGKALSPVEWNYGSVALRLQPFFCRISGGEPRAIEHQELRWTAVNAVDSLDWAPADEPILEELKSAEF